MTFLYNININVFHNNVIERYVESMIFKIVVQDMFRRLEENELNQMSRIIFRAGTSVYQPNIFFKNQA